MTNPGTYTKAILTAVAAGVGPYIAATRPESQHGVAVSLGELLTIIGAVLIGSVAVWSVDNVRWFKTAKAATGAAAQFLGLLSVMFLAGRTPTAPDVVQMLLTVAVTYGVVWVAPNAASSDFHDPAGGDGQPEPDDLHDPDADLRLNYPETFDVHVEGSRTFDGNGNPIDADGDGHDDRNGQWMPGHARWAVPGGALALILGGAPMHQLVGELGRRVGNGCAVEVAGWRAQTSRTA